MKKCPFCKAGIEDNARFCLYCMKPLNEKEVIPPPQRKPQWWPFAVAAVLLVALLVVILLIPKGNADRPSESTGEESTSTGQTVDSQASQATDEGTQNTQNEGGESQGDTTLEEKQNATGTPGTNQKPDQHQNINTQTPTESTTPATKPIPSSVFSSYNASSFSFAARQPICILIISYSAFFSIYFVIINENF